LLKLLVWSISAYLISGRTECSRTLTTLQTDCDGMRALDASYYYTGYKVVKVCRPHTITTDHLHRAPE